MPGHTRTVFNLCSEYIGRNESDTNYRFMELVKKHYNEDDSIESITYTKTRRGHS